MGRPGRRAGDLPQRPLSRERRLPLGPRRGIDRLRDGRPRPSAVGRRHRGGDLGTAGRPGSSGPAPGGPRRDRATRRARPRVRPRSRSKRRSSSTSSTRSAATPWRTPAPRSPPGTSGHSATGRMPAATDESRPTMPGSLVGARRSSGPLEADASAAADCTSPGQSLDALVDPAAAMPIIDGRRALMRRRPVSPIGDVSRATLVIDRAGPSPRTAPRLRPRSIASDRASATAPRDAGQIHGRQSAQFAGHIGFRVRHVSALVDLVLQAAAVVACSRWRRGLWGL